MGEEVVDSFITSEFVLEGTSNADTETFDQEATLELFNVAAARPIDVKSNVSSCKKYIVEWYLAVTSPALGEKGYGDSTRSDGRSDI